MANVKEVVPPPPPVAYTIELTFDEALALHTLFNSGVSCSAMNKLGLDELSEKLGKTRLGSDRFDILFTDIAKIHY